MKDRLSHPRLFRQFMDINREAFEAGLFDAAYHALAGALHCVRDAGPDESLLEIANTARTQLAWINTNQGSYHHSSQSASERRHESIFEMLARQADTLVKMHKHAP